MIFRLLFFAILIGGGYFFIRKLLGNSDHRTCEKCDGKGYWRAMRGEKERCDLCEGSGKVPR